MTVRLAANVDDVTGELYLGNQKIATYTASAFNLVDNAGATKFSVALATGNTTVAGTLTSTGLVTANAGINVDAGAVATPGLYLEGETGTGLYRIGANNHGYAVSGAKVLDIASTGLAVTGVIGSDGKITSSNGASNDVSFEAIGSGALTGYGLNATGAGGRNYSLISTANASGLGGGLLVLYDRTAGAYRATFSTTVATVFTAAWTYNSDRRLKENEAAIDNGLSVINGLVPKNFDYINGAKKQSGFIAQDVQLVLPDAVSVVNEETGYLGLRTEAIIPYAVKAIQELAAKVAALEVK